LNNYFYLDFDRKMLIRLKEKIGVYGKNRFFPSLRGESKSGFLV
jgi:hypothetical protein